MTGATQTITCPVCKRTSHHPTDVVEGYCGACHDWTSPPATAPRTAARPGQPTRTRR
jgi:ribosomal protein L37AE/L43A